MHNKSGAPGATAGSPAPVGKSASRIWTVLCWISVATALFCHFSGWGTASIAFGLIAAFLFYIDIKARLSSEESGRINVGK